MSQIVQAAQANPSLIYTMLPAIISGVSGLAGGFLGAFIAKANVKQTLENQNTIFEKNLTEQRKSIIRNKRLEIYSQLTSFLVEVHTTFTINRKNDSSKEEILDDFQLKEMEHLCSSLEIFWHEQIGLFTLFSNNKITEEMHAFMEIQAQILKSENPSDDIYLKYDDTYLKLIAFMKIEIGATD
jgi:hypothetical protein